MALPNNRYQDPQKSLDAIRSEKVGCKQCKYNLELEDKKFCIYGYHDYPNATAHTCFRWKQFPKKDTRGTK
jgi:hypothetical protein